jgi:hypothetical protein
MGHGLGTILPQGFGVSAAAPDICAEPQPTLTGNAGIDRDGFGVHVRDQCLFVATHAIDSTAPLLAFNSPMSVAKRQIPAFKAGN